MSPAGPLLVLVLVAAAALGASGRARAQPAAAAPSSKTLLHLSTTGTARAAPDQLVADLVAQATSPSAAAAQRRVNSLIADALRAAQGVPGVEAGAVGYAGAPADDRRARWTAH